MGVALSDGDAEAKPARLLRELHCVDRKVLRRESEGIFVPRMHKHPIVRALDDAQTTGKLKGCRCVAGHGDRYRP